MPSTVPSASPVAMNDRTSGTRTLQTSCEPSRVPMVNSENEAGALVVVERLGGGHLHRLLLGHQPGLQVAGDHDADAGDQDGHQRHAQRRPEDLGVSCRRARCQALMPSTNMPGGDGTPR